MLAAELYEALQPLLRDPKPPDSSQTIWSFCPCHADGSKHGRRSLALHPTKGLTCFAGCERADILKVLGYQNRPAERAAPMGEPAIVYDYVDAKGKLTAQKARFESPQGKTFAWRLPGAEDWHEGLKGLKVHDLPLYNLPALLRTGPDAPIYIVEGEKAADACGKAGLVAVSLASSSIPATYQSESLEPLRGRTVWLWPDNDPPGQEFMRRLHHALQGLARALHFVQPPFDLGPKGDAHDYFGLGGTAEALQGSPTAPSTEDMGEESLRVNMPTPSGLWHFEFTDMTRAGRRLDAELTISRNGTGPEDTYNEAVNLMSSTQRTEIRRELDAYYGKEHNWAVTLNRVWALAKNAHANKDLSVDAAAIEEPIEEIMLINPLVPRAMPTIFFGDGESLKTFLLLSIMKASALQESLLGLTVPKMHCLYIDYEGTAQSFRRRLTRLCLASGRNDLPLESIRYWPGRGLPLGDHLDSLRPFIQKHGIGLVGIDSIAPALGGKPEDAEVAVRFFRWLSRLGPGVTPIALAHVTKAGENKYPFGSVFFHNEARRTWYVERESEEEATELDIALYCRKVNDGPRPRSMIWHFTFDDPNGPITLSRGDWASTESLNKKRSYFARAYDVLLRGHQTVAQIVETFELPTEQQQTDARLQVRKALNKQKGRRVATFGTITGTAGRPQELWGALSQENRDESQGRK